MNGCMGRPVQNAKSPLIAATAPWRWAITRLVVWKPGTRSACRPGTADATTAGDGDGEPVTGPFGIPTAAAVPVGNSPTAGRGVGRPADTFPVSGGPGRDNRGVSTMDDRLRDIEARYEAVQAELSSPGVAEDRDRLRRLGKELSELGEIVVPYREYRLALTAAEEAGAAEDRAAGLRKRLEELLVPKDPNDAKDVVLEIRAGPGGQEAMLWAGDLYELYRRYAERRRYKTEVLSASPSDLGGFKEVVMEVRGKGAYSRLKHESGTHRVQRVPVTESSGRIHTSTATVAVLPEAEEVEVDVRQEDLDIDVFRSSGPGGQSVNTTDSAVRITHKPSGIVVTSQEERSQLQNREKAMRYLRARLYQQALDARQAKEAAARKLQVGSGDRAEKIRTYNFPDKRVTDHRVKVTSHNLQAVLDGDIDEFVDALMAAERAAQLAGEDGQRPAGGGADGPDDEDDDGSGDGRR